MSIIFSNVNLVKIDFINEKLDLRFEFRDAYYNSFKYCGELICKNIYALKINADPNDIQEFAYFVCDVIATPLDAVEIESTLKNYNYGCSSLLFKDSNQTNKNYQFIRFEGEIDISIVCHSFIIKKV